MSWPGRENGLESLEEYTRVESVSTSSRQDARVEAEPPYRPPGVGPEIRLLEAT
ncbi:MAG: hypothetical protein AVDCRST_MAG80-1018 [uncultured Rubrobacteraceae bacterium]|uniref:Uncharacterized protein n=1 Tax=uncultured Rubrobacteraceae bacterium TaxID=349277 RepID=A0A6J4QH08_9ACTN|nr:MAG: hypothetical protein AVDCRST_MAG80-1018 [uncultured Rubrobacteraceae bacterium]